MPYYDFRSPRVYLPAPLIHGEQVRLEQPQAHYLMHVLRLKSGDSVLAFNGRDGEWRTTIFAERRNTGLQPVEQTRAQTMPGDLHYLFAPLKHARLDYMVQKATEMGASRLQPVLTRHTQVTRLNTERMRSNAIEAAEQCGILNVPEIAEPASLVAAIAALEPKRLLVFCDEDAEVADPLAALAAARQSGEERPPIAVLIGPEGGFAEDERVLLRGRLRVTRLALGPRILRADTAGVAALTLVQAALGDWK